MSPGSLPSTPDVKEPANGSIMRVDCRPVPAAGRSGVLKYSYPVAVNFSVHPPAASRSRSNTENPTSAVGGKMIVSSMPSHV